MHSNIRGFTLVETMISLGLSSIIIFAALEIQINMTKLQNTAVQKENLLELKEDFRRQINSRCGTILSGQEYGNAVTVRFGTGIGGSRLRGDVTAGTQIDKYSIQQISLIDDPARPNSDPNVLQSYLLHVETALNAGTFVGASTQSFDIAITARRSSTAPNPIVDCAAPGTSGEQCLNFGIASNCPLSGISFATLFSVCGQVGLGVHFCYPTTGGFLKAAQWVRDWRNLASPVPSHSTDGGPNPMN